jgi:CRP/FNR family cyclic AMP-dependent transcriptional regulator
MSTNAAMLAEIPVFSLLDDHERTTLAGLLESDSFAAGQRIYGPGDAGDCLYIVRRGRVTISVEDNMGELITLAENEPGDVFGEFSLLDGGPRTAYAEAGEPTEALRLDRDALLELVNSHPHSALDLLTMVGRRLRATEELLRTRVSRNANVEAAERVTLGERVADRVAIFGGSWTFIILFGVVIAAWVAVNSALVLRHPFDPYPYIFLNLVLSMLAALQAPVIMMSQNRQAAKDRLKSDLDYEVNLKAELEVANLHRKVDRIHEVLEEHWAEERKARQ